MRYGICVVIGKPAANSDSMVSETFAPELARSACPAALLTEHEGKKELLRRLDIGFMELEPPDGAANFIYTRDQMVMTRQGRVLFCSMQRPERRPEVTVFKQTFGVKSGRVLVAETACVAELSGGDAFQEGGDTMQFGTHNKPRAVLFQSRRSNARGIEITVEFLSKEGYRVDVLETTELHGTSGISVVGPEKMLVNPNMVDLRRVQRLGVETLVVPEAERRTLAANAAWYGADAVKTRRDVVICNADHPETAAVLDAAGYQVETLPFTHHHRGEGNTDCAMGQRFFVNFG